MSLIMRKPAFCICENKGADQLRGNCLVYVRPGQKPIDRFSHNEAQIYKYSHKNPAKMYLSLVYTGYSVTHRII